MERKAFSKFSSGKFMNSSPPLAIWPTLQKMHYSNFSMTLAIDYAGLFDD